MPKATPRTSAMVTTASDFFSREYQRKTSSLTLKMFVFKSAKSTLMAITPFVSPRDRPTKPFSKLWAHLLKKTAIHRKSKLRFRGAVDALLLPSDDASADSVALLDGGGGDEAVGRLGSPDDVSAGRVAVRGGGGGDEAVGRLCLGG